MLRFVNPLTVVKCTYYGQLLSFLTILSGLFVARLNRESLLGWNWLLIESISKLIALKVIISNWATIILRVVVISVHLQ